MSLVLTSNLSLGTWADGENPGAGSQTVNNSGLNGNWLKLDTAVGTEHNTDGTHKDDKIAGSSIKAAFADGSTLEMSASTGSKAIRVKDDGVTGAKLNSNVVDNTTLEVSASSGTKTIRIKDGGVATAKIADAAVTTAKLEYKEYAAYLNQSGTSAPTATIIKNTLGATPTFSRTSAGVYAISCAEFTTGKTVAIIGNSNDAGITVIVGTATPLTIATYDLVTTTSPTAIDEALADTHLLIRVYP